MVRSEEPGEESTTPSRVIDEEKIEVVSRTICQIRKVKSNYALIQVEINAVTISRVTHERCRAEIKHKRWLMT